MNQDRRTRGSKQRLEARFFPRAKIDLACFVTFEGKEQAGMFVDLSEGGGLLRCAFMLNLGDVIDVRAVTMPCEFVARAKVARLDDDSYGLSWVDLATDASEKLQCLITERIQICWDDRNGGVPKEVAVRFLPIIRRIARTFTHKIPRHLSLDDLVGAGFVALVEHQARHQDLASEEFEKMAMLRIRGAMQDELRKADPLSRRMRHRQREIGRATADLTRTLKRTPSEEEIARHLGVEQDALLQMQRLHASCRDLADESAFERHVDADTPNPEQVTSKAERLAKVSIAMNALPERLREILQMHFGQDLTLREIGNVIGVTEARVCQLVGTALKTLRKHCVSAPPPAF